MLDITDPKFDRLGNKDTLEQLIRLIKNNAVIPFVGAGMSVGIYELWGKSLEMLMDGYIFGCEAEMIRKEIEDKQYEKAASMISENLGKTAYHDQIVTVFGVKQITNDKLQTMPVRYLPKIFNDTVVITTNFDKILEKIFLLKNYPFDEKVVLQHLTQWQADKLRKGSLHYLIKIHGCVSAPDEVVMSAREYQRLYNQKENSIHIERLRHILGGNTLLFLGCSLNEDRTISLLQKVGYGGHFAILEMNEKADSSIFIERRRFMSEKLTMHCLWYPKDEHHYVTEILEYIAQKVHKSNSEPRVSKK